MGLRAPGSPEPPAKKRFFPSYKRYPTAAIPNLSIRIQILKMNTTTNTTTPERTASESQRSFSGRRSQHHVTFFCNAPEAESVRLVDDFNRWDLAPTPMQRKPDGRWTVSWKRTMAIINT